MQQLLFLFRPSEGGWEGRLGANAPEIELLGDAKLLQTQ